MFKKLFILSILSLATFVWFAPTTVRAASQGVTFTVNTIADEPDAKPGDGKCKSAPSKQCTLRAAVMETNALGGTDTIVLPSSALPYLLTYTGAYNDNARTGDLDILDDLVIQGGGAASTVIHGYNSDRIFHILAGKAKIMQVKLTGGSAAGNFNFGGGINVESGATLILNKSIVQANTSWLGGGLYNAGRTTIKRSTIQQNSVVGYGGGIQNAGTGTLRLDATTVTRNSATADGGGIRNNGILYINASTIDHNAAENGAGLAQSGTLSTMLVNSTLANNDARHQGGGIYASGTFSLFHVTIASNTISTAGYGKGAGLYQAPTGNANLWNTLFDWNTYAVTTPPFYARGDCEGAVTSHDYNLLSTTDNCTVTGTTSHDIYNAPAYTGFLANNGGPTQTVPLPNDSMAVDVIPARDCVGPDGLLLVQLTRDQRGQPRPKDGNGDGTKKCDMGAYEVQP